MGVRATPTTDESGGSNMHNSLKNILLFGAICSTIIATGTLKSMAASSPAPKFDPPVKVFSGRSQAPGSKVLATDGVRFYTAFIAVEGSKPLNTLKLASGSNDGKTWDIASTIIQKGLRVLDEQVSVAVSPDIASPARRIVHVVWNQRDDVQSGTKAGLYYSWASDAALNTWSEPVRINGAVADVHSISLVANKSGELHVVFLGRDRKMYHCSAASPQATFTKPAIVPGSPIDDDRAVDVVLDSSNNLHIGFATVDDAGKTAIKYTRKASKAGDWTIPVEVIPPTTINNQGHFAIAASDANTIYVASTIVNEAALDVYSSRNGGKLWTRKTVANDKTSKHVSIAANPDKTLTVGVAFVDPKTGAENARIYRSTDGVTWGAAAIIQDQTSVNLAVDTNGKVGVLTYSADHLHYFSKEL